MWSGIGDFDGNVHCCLDFFSFTIINLIVYGRTWRCYISIPTTIRMKILCKPHGRDLLGISKSTTVVAYHSLPP